MFNPRYARENIPTDSNESPPRPIFAHGDVLSQYVLVD